jgi:hypothetical protein
MARDLTLYREADGLNLDEVKGDLAVALQNQAAQLRYLSEPGRPRKMDWSGFVSSSILTAIIAAPGWIVWENVSHPWWAFIIAAPYAFLVFVAVVATLSNLFEREDEPPAGSPGSSG